MAVVCGAQSPASPQFRYGAPVDIRSFEYRRDLAASRPGVTEFTLDGAALAHCDPAFADLRIVAAGGRQVPYVVTKDANPISIELPVPERDASLPARMLRRAWPDDRGIANGDHRISRYLVRLPYSHLPPARLVLRTPARVFQRELWLEVGPRRGADRPAHDWRIIADSWWSNADPGADAPPLTFEFGTLPASDLHLAVDEGNNADLPLGRPTLLLPAYRVRFIRPAAALQLLYGNPRLEAPRYDLALEARALLDLPAERVTLGPEQPARTGRVPAGVLFWSALAVAVVVLLGLVARLAGKGDV